MGTLTYIQLVFIAMSLASNILKWKTAATAAASPDGASISPEEWSELGYIITQSLLSSLPVMDLQTGLKVAEGMDKAFDEYFPGFASVKGDNRIT